ncbi:uncharacterized protein [Pocillopora verrucosa]|uniref:uncharacterized protein n=1 Tax=Pocillopora verrucosa TaxID=203993 RepID=UPI0033401EF6
MNFLMSHLRGIFYPPGTTPLNWRLFSIVFLSSFCSAMSITILFPFLPAMVKSFGISDEDTGYYAGVIASSMFIGRTAACYFWGLMTDRFGRRPVMMICLTMTLVGMVCFGLSVSLYMAFITRLFVGLSAGIVGTCKTIASEVSDNTNQAMAMSIILTSWNVGLIIGPAIGGYLAEPSQKYPSVFTKDSLFNKFPFFLPCLLNCAALLLTVVLAYFYLPETLVTSDNETSSSGSETGELAMQSTASNSLIDEDDENSCTKKNSLEETEEVEIFINDVNKEDIDNDGNCCGFKSCCCPRYRCCKFFRDSKIAVLLRDRVVTLAICVYCTLSFVVIGYDELFSLWAATGPEHGGLGFSTDQIGTALLCVAGPMLVLQLWLYPKLERRLGSIRVFQLANIVLGITITSLSALNTLHDRSKVLWPLLIVVLIPLRMGIGCGFSSTGILVNNAVPAYLLGSANGLAMTASSISRTLAPLVAGSAFAWSISKGYKHGFPLDEHFAFILLSIVCFLAVLLSCTLPKRLNMRPSEPVKV